MEAVTEAVIDGRAAAVPAAAERAQAWWRLHGAELGDPADGGTRVSRMVRAARTRDALEAARISVELSAASLGWCPGRLSTADRLMVADLAGMAAWLRAHGVASVEPANGRATIDDIDAALLRARHPELATRLRTAYAAVQPRESGKPADARAAARLLDLVDEVEKVLR